MVKGMFVSRLSRNVIDLYVTDKSEFQIISVSQVVVLALL